MFRITNRRHRIDSVFVLVVLLLFGMTAYVFVLFGTTQYEHTVDVMEQNYNVRTTSSYLIEKVRGMDLSDAEISTDDGTLAITEKIGEGRYTTYIYTYDGYLCETLIAEGTELNPEAGQRLTEVTDFTPSYSDGVLSMTYVDLDGMKHECAVSTKSN